MPAKWNLPRAQFHLSLFLNVGGASSRRLVSYSTAQPVDLTPARMKLLAKLVEPDQWTKHAKSRATTWDEIEATVARALSSN